MGSQIVTVDVSNFEDRKHEIASQLLNASKDVGFFYIAGARSQFYRFTHGGATACDEPALRKFSKYDANKAHDRVNH